MPLLNIQLLYCFPVDKLSLLFHRLIIISNPRFCNEFTMKSIPRAIHCVMLQMCNKRRGQVKLNLPMLKFIPLKKVRGIKKLTLNTPRLWKVKKSWCSLSLDLINGESVEWLTIHPKSSENENFEESKVSLNRAFQRNRLSIAIGFGSAKSDSSDW